MSAGERDSLPLVAFLLGTDHHRFDRLVRWSTELGSVGGCTCFVQHGATPLPGLLPSNVDGAPVLGGGDLADLLSRADCVVTHGGPGLVMEAREHGHQPVVVPRDPWWGEHVDDHQLRFARLLARAELATVATTQAECEQAITSALRVGRAARRVADNSDLCQRFGALAERVVPRPRLRRQPR